MDLKYNHLLRISKNCEIADFKVCYSSNSILYYVLDWKILKNLI